MVYRRAEIHFRIQRLHTGRWAPIRLPRLGHVILEGSSLLRTELPLNHKLKRVRYRLLQCVHLADEAGSADGNLVDRAHAELLLEAPIDEALNVELQIKPHPFQHHAAGHSHCGGRPRNVIFAVVVVAGSVKADPSLEPVCVCKDHLAGEGFLVEHLHLQQQIRLQEM